MINATTNTVAIGAVLSPLWLERIQTASELAGMFLPIFGVLWLVVQIAHKLMTRR